MKYSGHRKLLCEISKLSNLMLLTSSDTKRTLMHLFLFTNSSQRELVSIYTTAINFLCISTLRKWILLGQWTHNYQPLNSEQCRRIPRNLSTFRTIVHNFRTIFRAFPHISAQYSAQRNLDL